MTKTRFAALAILSFALIAVGCGCAPAASDTPTAADKTDSTSAKDGAAAPNASSATPFPGMQGAKMTVPSRDAKGGH